jgi:hypothetical protein
VANSPAADLSRSEEEGVQDESHVVLQGQQVFRHKLIYLNYTSYDLHQGQDVMNPLTDCRDIMFIAPDTSKTGRHRYLYAQVLGIFHANAMLSGLGSTSDCWECFDFLWICWFCVSGHQSE